LHDRFSDDITLHYLDPSSCIFGSGMREHVLPQAQAGEGLRAGGSGGEKGDNAGGGTGGVGAAAAWNVNRESVLKVEARPTMQFSSYSMAGAGVCGGD
jgi:hypothetical protein